MKLKYFRYSQNKGMSLIELLIAMTIGMLLMLGAVTLFSNNKRIYREVNSMGRLQENARFAIELLIRDIRMAGYAGCADSISDVTNNVNNSSDDDNLYSFENAIEGSESAAKWQPSNSTEQVTSINAGTDAITIRFMKPSGLTLDEPYHPPTAAAMFTNGSDGLSIGQIVAITDCSSADVFQITNLQTSSSTKTTVTHNAGTGTPGNSTQTLSKSYGDDAQFLIMVSRRYYIGDENADGIPSLYRYHRVIDKDDFDGDNDKTEVTELPQELIEGVERMEILYGVDNTSDTVADSYVNAAGVTAAGGWDNVVSVQISLLFQTVRENFNSPLNEKKYTLLNSAEYDPVDDHRRRRIVTNTIQIRNRSN
jgi:type IV pilus assembly protein PilW